MRYTLSQIAKITGGQHIGCDITIDDIIIDSRSINTTPLSLFIALRGSGRDGHDYIVDAATNGMRAFMVEKIDTTYDIVSNGYVVVNSTLSALQSLAKYHREAFSGEVVAITGSNGKTTSKEWFSQLWNSSDGKLYRSPRSYNSQIGVALSLLKIEGDERVVIIEAGISKPGEMQRLEEMIRPTIGVLTNIGDAHSENFLTVEQKTEEKLKLFLNVAPNKIIRGDKHNSSTPEEHNRWVVEQIYNMLAISVDTTLDVIPLSLRLEVQQGVLNSLIINDSYSNDLVSLSAALDFAQREATGRPLHLIVTDIEQSSLSEDELYRTLCEILKKYSIERVVAIGHNISKQKGNFNSKSTKFFQSTEQFLDTLNPLDFASAAVLIKGARSFRTERISARLEERTHTTTLEVNLSKITENFKHYKSLLKPHTKSMAMVKASSYGLGSLQISQTLLDSGVDYLAVAFADEGILLRKGGITAPIVVLNSDPGSFRAMIEYSLEPEIYSLSALSSYCKEVKKAGATKRAIHIKLDTGMHRLGFMQEDINALCSALIKEKQSVRVASIFSHLAAADDSNEDEFTMSQFALFDKFCAEIIEAIGYHPLLSITNTAGTERFPNQHHDMVRIGIGLYIGSATLRCKITQIKTIQKGETIGYNRRGVAERTTRLAIIPIGYADGLRRALGCTVGQVLVESTLCNIVGNICMDTTIIDITDAPNSVKEGDSVMVMGGEVLGETILAQKLNTISYEVLTAISPRIKRLYVW